MCRGNARRHSRCRRVRSCRANTEPPPLFGLALWPNLAIAGNDVPNSLTLSRAASRERTLWIMLIVAMIGMPLVLVYTTTIYWTFRGKVEVSESGY